MPSAEDYCQNYEKKRLRSQEKDERRNIIERTQSRYCGVCVVIVYIYQIPNEAAPGGRRVRENGKCRGRLAPTRMELLSDAVFIADLHPVGSRSRTTSARATAPYICCCNDPRDMLKARHKSMLPEQPHTTAYKRWNHY